MYANANGLSGSFARNKKEPKVSIVFRQCGPEQHCAGVESLLLSPDDTYLYSASRDSTIKRWNVSGDQPVFETSFEGHVDWVNDVVLLQDALVSCSSDRTIKVWRAFADGPCAHTFSPHSDYITCLAAATQKNWIASAGLRSEIFMIDLQSSAVRQLYPKTPAVGLTRTPSGNLPPVGMAAAAAAAAAATTAVTSVGEREKALMGLKGSVYALDMNASATLLVAGSSKHALRVFDPRTGVKVMKLKGHTDNVRSLLLNVDGRKVLSAGSDASVRLWDLAMGRCVQHVALHADSVWALAPLDSSFSSVLTGGRDRAVYRVHLPTRAAELVVVEEQAVRDMAYSASSSSVWVSTASSSVVQWAVPAEVLPVAGSGAAAPERAPSFTHGRSFLGARLRLSVDVRNPGHPLSRQPTAVLTGAPGLVVCKALPDRRYVLTRDVAGAVCKWDVLTGAIVEAYGAVDFAEKERELFTPHAMLNWYTSDTKLGSLALHLETPSCFTGEVYAAALGYRGVSDDLKFNFGAMLLRHVFSVWAARSGRLDVSPPEAAAGDQNVSLPKYSTQTPPSVISQHSSGLYWRIPMTAFTGAEREGEDIPVWVVDALRGSIPVHKDTKASFVLLPAEGSNLPSLLQSRLTAPRILEVWKVAAYCASKLGESNLKVVVRQASLARPAAPLPPLPPGERYLELLCNEWAVPFELSLAAVRAYLWRRSDDVVFHFRLLDPKSPAPLPTITPPA